MPFHGDDQSPQNGLSIAQHYNNRYSISWTPPHRSLCISSQHATPISTGLCDGRPQHRLDEHNFIRWRLSPMFLLTSVLTKIERKRCKIILIALLWPRQAWFTRLTDLLIGTPIILPKRPDLLFQSRSGLFHPDPESLHLSADYNTTSNGAPTRQLIRTLHL